MEEHPEKTEEIRKEREKRIDSQMKRAIEVIKEYRLIERILSGKKQREALYTSWLEF